MACMQNITSVNPTHRVTITDTEPYPSELVEDHTRHYFTYLVIFNMTDFVVNTTATAVAKVAVSEIVSHFRGEYDEQQVKEQILQKLDVLKDHLEALRNKEFKTALETLTMWSRSENDANNKLNMDRLRKAQELSMEAAHIVKDPIDKVRSYAMNIYAVYFRQAFLGIREGKSEEASFRLAKRETQNILRVVLEKDFVRSACEVESGKSFISYMRPKTSRRLLLAEVASISHAVLSLPPCSENWSHPCLDIFDEAVTKMTSEGSTHIQKELVDRIINPKLHKTLAGHSGWVQCCAVFDGDSKAISGSDDKTLKVWDLKSGSCVHTLRGHSDGVICCAVFDGDSKAISGSGDKTLKVWDLKSGSCVHTLTGHSDGVRFCAVFDGDSKAISGSWDKTLKVWHLPPVASHDAQNTKKLGPADDGGRNFNSAIIDLAPVSLTIESSTESGGGLKASSTFDEPALSITSDPQEREAYDMDIHSEIGHFQP